MRPFRNLIGRPPLRGPKASPGCAVVVLLLAWCVPVQHGSHRAPVKQWLMNATGLNDLGFEVKLFVDRLTLKAETVFAHLVRIPFNPSPSPWP